MRIIAISRAVEFYDLRPDSRLPIEVWFNQLKVAKIMKLKNLSQTVNAAEVLGSNRVVFAINAQKYRLVAKVVPRSQTVYIRRIDPKEIFDKINAHTVYLESAMEPQPIKPIRTKADYKAALQRLDLLLDRSPAPKSDLDDELEVLTTLVHAYEQVEYPIAIPDPIDALKFIMEDKGLQQKDLEPYIGPKSRVSEILNRKRYFTLQQINNLHKHLKLPLAVFINDEAIKAS